MRKRKLPKRQPMLLERFALGRPNGRPGGYEFWVDHDRFPMENALTTDLGKARKWTERTGPWKMLQRHESLRKALKVIPVP